MNNTIATAAAARAPAAQDLKKQGVNAVLTSVIDGEKMRKRFDELLGKRTPQFLSSLTTLINADENLQAALYEAPLTIISAALKAATFDLPIEPSLGYAYIVPFKNKRKGPDGEWTTRSEATFIIGYKGMTQLCLRTGAYSRVPDAVDVRQGELVRYDRLTGDAEFKWMEDEDARERLPIIGYAGYFRLKNGAEKTIYMTVDQIKAHERKHRKGQYQGKGWRDDFDAMARKTVIRRLVGKYGLMSIEYRDSADAETVSLAQSLFDENAPEYPNYTAGAGDDLVEISDDAIVDPSTGEVITA